ncbi:Uncharacterized protein APZ42_030262 [Daphnia magna]|uniref:Uncharacterized protein n=1 Tax=Daphnia magna TaxID=35525 RepID=A0A164NWU2_9CRUS|nr:Uncharacterized protein APZ42_030262 [Daphnia magna]
MWMDFCSSRGGYMVNCPAGSSGSCYNRWCSI